jgi:hypothetical protein
MDTSNADPKPLNTISDEALKAVGDPLGSLEGVGETKTGNTQVTVIEDTEEIFAGCTLGAYPVQL